LARELGISTNRLNELVRGKRGITADTALRLARRFDTSAEFWMNLQSAYELTQARKEMAGD
jgi:antitoxin HigA-1